MVKKFSFIVFDVLLILIVSILTTTSCSKYQKVLKSPDNEKKYEYAIALYEKGDYNRAIQLFDVLLPVYRGTSKAETIYYDYAYSYYHQGNYDLAAYFFKMYTQLYPISDKTEDAAFKVAYCNYKLSPKASLDQMSTDLALKELQKFVNTYPKSEKVTECNQLIDELRAKLQLKAFNIAILYYNMEDYPAAVKSFENLIADFPELNNKEEVLFYIFKSYFLFAKKSIEEKKKERYESAMESFNDLIYLFPETSYLKEASGYHKSVKKELNIK